MSTLTSLTIDLSVGQEILVGKNRQPATITKIEYHPRSGEAVIRTTRGTRKVLTFALPREVEVGPTAA